jgi:ribosomal protein S18 acetylase RimI-like enzyme
MYFGKNLMNEILIRDAKETDSLDIKELLKITWLHSYKEYIPENIILLINNKFHSEKRIIDQVNDKNIIFKVAEINNEIIGTISLNRLSEDEFNLNRLYINPNFQGKSIGKKLLNSSLNEFKINKITLEVLKNNIRAINFYKSLGFKEIGESDFEIDGFIINNIIFEKNLS